MTVVVPLHVALVGQTAQDLSVKRYCAFVQSWIHFPSLSFTYPVLQVYVFVPLQVALAGQAVHLPSLINLFGHVQETSPVVAFSFLVKPLLQLMSFLPGHVALAGHE